MTKIKFQRSAISGALLFALAAFVLPASQTPAQAAEFNDAQREEMGVIIREYLLKNPGILLELSQELQKRQEAEKSAAADKAIKENAADLYRAKGDPIVGNPDGKISIIEYFDYNCGFCKRSLVDLQKLIENNKDLRVVIKEFPIFGEDSTFAARAALAAGKQNKYWELHVALMEEQRRINKDVTLEVAKKIGLDVAKLQGRYEVRRHHRRVKAQ